MYRGPWPTIPFYLCFLLPPLVVLCIFERGWWTFAPLGIVFVLLPLFDRLFGVAGQWREAPDLAFNKYFRVVTWLWVPLQLALLVWVLDRVSAGRLTDLEVVGATLSMGITAGAIGATVAHELIHRRSLQERLLGHLLLGTIGYLHFAVNHIHGHHRWVATPLDPATARLNENFYMFLPRAVVGGFRSALVIERERLHRMNDRGWLFTNRVLRGLVLQALLGSAVWVWLGPRAAAVLAGQAAIAILIVEAINYVEHYGLRRREVARGEYERVAPYHSWDSAYRVSNWLLINLPRHADHHCSASKRYQGLELLPQAPRLPAGYGAMFLLALVPPLWFSVMNPRVVAAGRLAPPA